MHGSRFTRSNSRETSDQRFRSRPFDDVKGLRGAFVLRVVTCRCSGPRIVRTGTEVTVGLEDVLRRWDRRNQATVCGDISAAALEQWHWQREVVDGQTRLTFGRIVLDDAGVSGRVIRRRRWSWDDVVLLTWDLIEASASLAVCVLGDPYVKNLGGGSLDAEQWRALLEDCRSFVEAHGAHVDSRAEPASLWWAHLPEARS